MDRMEDQYSCDEEELEQEEQEGSLVSRSGQGRESRTGGGVTASEASLLEVLEYDDVSGDEDWEDEEEVDFVSRCRQRAQDSPLVRGQSQARVSNRGSRPPSQGRSKEQGASIGQERSGRGASVGWESSSQVARSIIGGIFRGLPGVQEERQMEQEQEELEELELTNRSLVEEDSSEDPLEHVAKQKLELDESHRSFSERMKDWINTVSLKQAEEQEFSIKTEDTSEHLSKHGEDLSVENITDIEHDQNMDDEEVFIHSTPHKAASIHSHSDKNDKMSTSSRKSCLHDTQSNYSGKSKHSKEEEEEQADSGYSQELLSLSDSDLRSRFHSDSSPRGISCSMLPSLAFSSYEQGFARAQQQNGKQLYENGLIRQRSGSGVRSLPFPEQQEKAAWRKVVETTESRVVVEVDGRQTVDTKHRREQEEGSGVKGSWTWCFFSFTCLLLFLLLLLLLAQALLPGLPSRGLHCLLQEVHNLPEEVQSTISV